MIDGQEKWEAVTLHVRILSEVDPTLGLVMEVRSRMGERNHPKKSPFSLL